MMSLLEAVVYTGLGGIVATITGWNYVLKCVDESARLIREHTAESYDYSAEEKELIEKYLQESLNKIK